MRIAPSYPRLRIIAVACWSIGGWCLLQPGLLANTGQNLALATAVGLAGILILALGVAFWLLGTDQRAGVVFDSKGLMLNLGHSAAFVGWENIAEVGVSQWRANILALGSRAQLGIRLSHPEPYLQSYEVRLPASRSLLGATLRLLRRGLHMASSTPSRPSAASLQSLRRRCGYDLLIPEALLGGNAAAFAAMVELYRCNPAQQRSLQLRDVASSA